MAKYKITEKTINEAVKSTLNEFLNRDDVDTMTSVGIKDPTENDVVNVDELKQKCSEFIQKSQEYFQYFNQFYGYIDGVEEDEEKGLTGTPGVRGTIRNRNAFGARNLGDEYLEQDLNYFAETLRNLKWGFTEVIECAEGFLS